MEKLKSGNKIAQYIYDDYIYNRDLSTNDDITKNMNLLVENDLAVKIAGNDILDNNMNRRVSRYRVISKFFIKHDKSLKKNRFEYEHDRKYADSDPEIIDLYNYQLDIGTYYLDLSDKGNSDYAMLIISLDKEDDLGVIFELYFIGHRCNKFKKKILKEFRHYNDILKNKKIEGFMYSDNRPFKPSIFKSFDQMVFSGKGEIISYIDKWVEHIPQYAKYGMIPKLSILLYGDPGVGKSTFYKALAKYLGIDTVRIILPDYFSSTPVNNRGLSARGIEAISVIDDIDCVSQSRDDNKSNENGHTVSSLLEFLDNPPVFYYTAKDGLSYQVAIVVATTNYIDKLDEAVKRYGRFDLKINLRPFNFKEAKEMCSIYDLSIYDVIKEKIDKNNFTISPAQLQALCMENIDKALKGTVK